MTDSRHRQRVMSTCERRGCRTLEKNQEGEDHETHFLWFLMTALAPKTLNDPCFSSLETSYRVDLLLQTTTSLSPRVPHSNEPYHIGEGVTPLSLSLLIVD